MKEVRESIPLAERRALILPTAAWFGLLGGLGEVALLGVAKFGMHRFVHESPHVVWMAPLADMLLACAVGLLLYLAGRRWPRLAAPSVAAFVFAFLACLGVLFRVTWLASYAALLLSAGFAAQAAHFIGKHPRGFRALARRTLPVLAGVVVLLAIGAFSREAFAERNALAGLPAAAPGAPNVIVVTLDTVRAQSLSLYGYSRPTTPQLEKLAKTGVTFDMAIATAPWTLPSHASMFTGRYPHELSADWARPLDGAYPTLAEVLAQHGYVTGGFAANTTFTTAESGLARGFSHYEDFRLSPQMLVLSSSLLNMLIVDHGKLFDAYDWALNRKTADKLNESFLGWLARRDQTRPFFAFLNYYDAHSPYLPPAPFDTLFSARTPRENPRILPGWTWSAEELQAEVDAYDESIAYLDQQLGQIFAQLQAQGVLDNTLVIITSDHGEEFREHGVMAHGYSTYLTPLHVPLVVIFPSRVPAGVSVAQTVSLRDLPATVLDLAGLRDASPIPGASLAGCWNTGCDNSGVAISTPLSELTLESNALPAWYPIRQGNLTSFIIEHYHYIRNEKGAEELYDLEADPLEKDELLRTAEGRQILESLRPYLAAIQPRHPFGNR